MEERKSRLEQQYWLYQLNREVDELEQWIAQKEVVASSPELGQDFEHVTVSVSKRDCQNENLKQEMTFHCFCCHAIRDLLNLFICIVLCPGFFHPAVSPGPAREVYKVCNGDRQFWPGASGSRQPNGGRAH